MGLDINILRAANEVRLPQFKDRLGNPAHDEVDGSDWTLAEWLDAAIGEAGELCSELKKARRGDYGKETKDAIRLQDYSKIDPVVRKKILKEVADVVIYLDLFCKQLKADMGSVIISKFNEVSERVGAKIYIENDGRGLSLDNPPPDIEY